ncbi:hypothetical protein DVH24_042380 [Malus domestica]|uniref:Uncharacterized protein n=1 Tax=Malus domestica TaxID=3750 RepID=A0A498IXY5_MALDO|nr:hypothetical protein DVH24_042380 [Malus domestica]
MYDSMKTATRKTTVKLAPITHVLIDVILSLSRDCGIFTLKVIELLYCTRELQYFPLKVIELLSAGLPLDVIIPSNILAFRLRMTIDMLQGVHNV